MKSKVKLTMMILAIIIGAVVIGGYIYMQTPKFGGKASGARLERMKKSPNYKDGKFKNETHTPTFADGVSYFTVFKDFLLNKSKRNVPEKPIPHEKVDLFKLDKSKNVVIWMGHSSYFLQIDGKRMLVDPVFSGSISPIAIGPGSYPGSDAYTCEDIPDLDYLFITHDHWDHLDYETVTKLKNKVKKAYMPLGVGAHLERWGYSQDKIIELDWWESVNLDSGFTLTSTPGKHFSGRTFIRNTTLWNSFVFKSPTQNIFINGDSGYDTHFKRIGDKFGPFDIALMECGQYNYYWKYIHMAPEETVQAVLDLNAKRFIPGHWAKFSLALHAWDDPIIRVTEESKIKGLKVLTPVLGSAIDLLDSGYVNKEWWKN